MNVKLATGLVGNPIMGYKIDCMCGFQSKDTYREETAVMLAGSHRSKCHQ